MTFILTSCTIPQLAIITNIVTYASIGGIALSLLGVVTMKYIIDNIVNKPSYGFYITRSTHIIIRLGIIMIFFNILLWFISPFFLPNSLSACTSPLVG